MLHAAWPAEQRTPAYGRKVSQGARDKKELSGLAADLKDQPDRQKQR
jgi:hypothetical protein